MPFYHVKGQPTAIKTGVRHIRRTPERLEAVRKDAVSSIPAGTKTDPAPVIGLQEAVRRAQDVRLPDADARVRTALESNAFAYETRPLGNDRTRYFINEAEFTTWLEAQHA